MLAVQVWGFHLAGSAEREGELSSRLVAQEGDEKSSGGLHSALDEAFIGLGGQVLEALSDDGGMSSGKLSSLADPGIPETNMSSIECLQSENRKIYSLKLRIKNLKKQKKRTGSRHPHS